MLLIYPPLAKPCEMPAGVTHLAGALSHHNIKTTVLDANLEGFQHLLTLPARGSDTWTRRAKGRIEENLSALGSNGTYGKIDRYTQAVMDLNRVVAMASPAPSIHMSLANYLDRDLSPVRSSDLVKAFETFEKSPFYPWFSRRLLAIIEDRQPSYAGFSLTYLSQALPTFAMIGFLRRVAPEIKIILGGGLLTSWMRKPDFRSPFSGIVDELIPGPGEKPLLRLLGVHDPKEHYAPDYSPLISGGYLSPGPVLPFSASTGCYWNKCSFCPERAEQNPYRPTPPKRVISDLSAAVKEHSPALIHLLDNAVSPSLFKAIAGDLPPTPWYGFCRVSNLLADPDFCMELRKSGCVMLKLGLESGDQEVLDSMGKGVRLETVSVVLENLKRAGIATYVYLLFGTLGETEEKARRTLDFTVKHSREIGFLNLAIFNLPTNSPEAGQVDTGAFYEGDLSLYRSFRHPRGWHRARVRQFLEKEFKKHPAVASILRGDPPLFTSNHAPFFAMADRSNAGSIFS